MDSRGNPLGAFRPEDLLLIINNDGNLKTASPELSTQFNVVPVVIERWIIGKPITLIYYDEIKKDYFIKRFLIENQNKELVYLKDATKLIFISTEWRPVISIKFKKKKGEESNQEKKINVVEFIDVKGFKASGNRLLTEKIFSKKKINKISLVESLPYEDSAENRVESKLEVNESDEVPKIEKTQTKLKF